MHADAMTATPSVMTVTSRAFPEKTPVVGKLDDANGREGDGVSSARPGSGSGDGNVNPSSASDIAR